MANASSNFDAIAAGLDELADAIDFTARGKDGGVAEDVAKLVALGIRDRVVIRQELPDGSRMADNAPAYAKRKANRPVSVGPDRDDHDGGEMMSEVELTGELDITPSDLTMTYGTKGETRTRAEWFSNGSAPGLGEGEPSGADNQPPRPFYGLDARIEAAVDGYLDSYLDSILGPT